MDGAAPALALPALSLEEMRVFLAEEYPGIGFADGRMVLLGLARGSCEVLLPFDPANVRPGPSVSGPSIMGLGDVSAWIALLSVIGRVPLAVTSNLNVSFLRPAGTNPLVCRCTTIRVGRRLATMVADVVREGGTDPVAHLTMTYALPPQGR